MRSLEDESFQAAVSQFSNGDQKDPRAALRPVAMTGLFGALSAVLWLGAKAVSRVK